MNQSANGLAAAFPRGFVWGTASSAYQIEGAVDADGRGPSIWDTFTHAGRAFHGDTGDVAVEHYRRFREDVDLLADLGVTSYRFSIAWPRIQPTGRGPANPAGIDFYKRLMDELQRKSIAPWVTLYHWDLPQTLEDEGGWLQRSTAEAFVDYATTVFTELKDYAQTWTTLNEPWCSAFLGYSGAHHAPGLQDNGNGAFRAAHHLMLAHGDAVAAMRAVDATKTFGVTVNLYAVDPASAAPADVAAAAVVDGQHNRLWLDPLLLGTYPDDMLAQAGAACGDLDFIHEGDLARIAQPLDALGVNYYTRHIVAAAPDAAPNPIYPGLSANFVSAGKPVTAMGWEIDPAGLREVLVRVHNDYPAVPLYVTENGAAFHDYVTPDGQVHDPERIDFLDGHFRAAADAIAAGVDLRGYFVWSVMDNFEWTHGYSYRFGVVFVDYGTQRRIVKDSGQWFREFIAATEP